MIYIILELIDFVQIFSMLGLLVQDKIMFGYPTPTPGLTLNVYAVITESICMTYAFFAIIISFYAYREFKGMMYDS